jgi:type I restriction enzyme, S subunit
MIGTDPSTPDTMCLSTDGLPEGWALGRVGDIVDLVNGFAFKPAHWKGRGLPIIRIQNLNNPGASFNYCPDSMPDKYVVETGDLLFAWSGTPGTSFGAHVWNGTKGLLNQHIFRVEFNENLLDKRFMRLAINHNLDDYIAQAHGGVGLAHITKGKFETSFLSLPPLTEQNRIVRKVDACFAPVTSARSHISRVAATLTRFREAVLAAACSGRLTEDWRNTHDVGEDGTALAKRVLAAKSSVKSDRVRLQRALPSIDDDEQPWELPGTWAYERLGNLCSHIADIDHKMPQSATEGVKFVSAKDLLDDGTLNLTREVKLISEADYVRLSRKAKPQRNDIIYSRIGARLGKARLVETDERFLVSYSCCIVRPLIINPKYLMGYLDSGVVLAKARQQARSIGVPDLGLDEINNFVVPLPPLAEQDEIVTRLDALLTLANRVEQHVTLVTNYCDSLTQSILAKAFRGELVPTEAELARREGREYEPASVLLERIKKWRESQTLGKPERRRTRSKTKAATTKGYVLAKT